MPELLSNARRGRQPRPSCRAAYRSAQRGASSSPSTRGKQRGSPSLSRIPHTPPLLPAHGDSTGRSEELAAPNDPSLCSSRGSLIRYNSVSRTPSHTETSPGVLQVRDHVKSNQMPVRMSSGAGRRLLPGSTPVPGSSAAHLPSLPRTRVSPPLSHQDSSSFSSTPYMR